jgi:hypothetical protein
MHQNECVQAAIRAVAAANWRRLKLGWSQFALTHNADPLAASAWLGKPDALLEVVAGFWDQRRPGVGHTDLTQAIVVPIFPGSLAKFTSRWIPIEQATDFQTVVVRRQPHEDPYLLTTAKGPMLPCRHASVVLYSSATLLENGGVRSGDFDWEIVAVSAGPWEKEPMIPLTMARNFLSKPGGTKATYSAEQLAESIYHWAGFVQARPA